MAYSGEYSDPVYGSKSPMLPQIDNAYLGAPSSPMHPNQLQEITDLSNTGIQNVEVGPIRPDLWEAIPKQHFQDISHMAKLSGIKPSVHAPTQNVEISGFGERGWSEDQRESTEQMLKSIVHRAYEIGKDTDEPIPFNVHSGNAAGSTWKIVEEDGERKKVEDVATVVNVATGQLDMIKHKERHYPGLEEPEVWDVQKTLNNKNRTGWDQEKLNLWNYAEKLRILEKEQGEKLLLLEHLDKERSDFESNKRKLAGELNFINSQKKEINSHMNSGVVNAFDTFHRAHVWKDPKLKPENVISSAVKEIRTQQQLSDEDKQKKIELLKATNQRSIDLQKKIESAKTESEYINAVSAKNENDANLIMALPSPKTWVRAETLAEVKAADTISNLALESFKSYGEKGPMITVENSYPQLVLSDAEGLDTALNNARDKFANKLAKEGMSRSKALGIAGKMIGATWDVGHVNLMKKFGYEDKDIVAETKAIADKVKHIHLTDNFGFEDSHLVPGMGSVPFKEMLKELEKSGALGRSRAIVEAGGMVQHFKTNPIPDILGAFNPSLYGSSSEAGWSDAADLYNVASGDYFAGYGTIFPEYHFSQYAAGGFSGLPSMLSGGGSDASGKRSQFGGTPMA